MGKAMCSDEDTPLAPRNSALCHLQQEQGGDGAKMRNFFVVVNILALTLPFLCLETEGMIDQKSVLYTPVHYALKSNLGYEPNYYHYSPSAPVSPYMYYPFVVKLLLLSSPVQASKWQPMPNFPQSIGVPRPVPSPSFLAFPTKETQESTDSSNISNPAAIEPTPAPVSEPVMTTEVIPEGSTVPINIPETATVPVLTTAA
ncbi:kappa-casein [Meriones unguiculatus]|uniref:kappa-casein n=1 Tax=Meriones unguiculatus TaxID=10047 RepID=UPI00293ED2CA|nr:kappa-casein [Meriones unguiculatus]